jgi:hypothetical protein
MWNNLTSALQALLAGTSLGAVALLSASPAAAQLGDPTASPRNNPTGHIASPPDERSRDLNISARNTDTRDTVPRDSTRWRTANEDTAMPSRWTRPATAPRLVTNRGWVEGDRTTIQRDNEASVRETMQSSRATGDTGRYASDVYDQWDGYALESQSRGGGNPREERVIEGRGDQLGDIRWQDQRFAQREDYPQYRRQEAYEQQQYRQDRYEERPFGRDRFEQRRYSEDRYQPRQLDRDDYEERQYQASRYEDRGYRQDRSEQQRYRDEQFEPRRDQQDQRFPQDQFERRQRDDRRARAPQYDERFDGQQEERRYQEPVRRTDIRDDRYGYGRGYEQQAQYQQYRQQQPDRRQYQQPYDPSYDQPQYYEQEAPQQGITLQDVREFADTAREYRDLARGVVGTVREIRGDEPILSGERRPLLRDDRFPRLGQRIELDARTARAPDLGIWFERRRDDGLVISDVASRGPVARAGLREGDRIVSIDGSRVGSERQFVRYLLSEELREEEVPVVIERDGTRETVYLRPSALIEQSGAGQSDPLEQFGVVLDDRYYDRVVVWKVVPRSAAFYAGLRKGDVITAVDDRSVLRAAQLERQIAQASPGDELQIAIRRGNQERTLDVEVPELEARVERRRALRPILDRFGNVIDRFGEQDRNVRIEIRTADQNDEE